MKQLNKYIVERLHINKDTINYYNYHPKDKDELKELIRKLIKERGNAADLNDIDTSEITIMDNMFGVFKFNGDISEWDVSNVKNMHSMFYCSKFNGDISNWDVSNVKDMNEMFSVSKFKGNISNWNVSNVKNMDRMFEYSPLQKHQPKWYKEYEANK